MGHDLTIIVMRILLFIGLYRIDTMSYHSCTYIIGTLMSCALFKHECHMSIRIV
jgi:hypothetical protein